MIHELLPGEIRIGTFPAKNGRRCEVTNQRPVLFNHLNSTNVVLSRIRTLKLEDRSGVIFGRHILHIDFDLYDINVHEEVEFTSRKTRDKVLDEIGQIVAEIVSSQ